MADFEKIKSELAQLTDKGEGAILPKSILSIIELAEQEDVSSSEIKMLLGELKTILEKNHNEQKADITKIQAKIHTLVEQENTSSKEIKGLLNKQSETLVKNHDEQKTEAARRRKELMVILAAVILVPVIAGMVVFFLIK